MVQVGASAAFPCECGGHYWRVSDTRAVEGAGYVRRRRYCDSCDRRVTTREKILADDIETASVRVVSALAAALSLVPASPEETPQ